MTAPATPDAALLRWVQSIPAVRCVAPAFRAWTKAEDKPVVPVTEVPAKSFAEYAFPGVDIVPGFTSAVGHANADTYALARVPSVPAVVLQLEHAGGGDYFAAVVVDRSSPPHAVATLPAAPRTRHGLGVGSSRAVVESALGAGHTKAICGFDVVRYEPRRVTSSEMWFLYRNGAVAAIVRFEEGG